MRRKSVYDVIIALPLHFFKMIASYHILMLLTVLVIIGITAHFKLKDYVLKEAKTRLSESLLLAKNIIENKKLNPTIICKLQLADPKTHYTLLSSDGQVICNSSSNLSFLANETLYQTIQIKDLKHISNFDQLIIKKAIPLSEINATIHHLDKGILLVLSPALLFITLFSIWMNVRPFYSLRLVIQRIYQINQSIFNTLSNTTFQFLDLNRNINHTTSVPQKKRRWPIIEKILEETQQNIEKTLDELHLENSKLNAIMESTQAGIVAVNKKGFVWFSNKQFQKIFPATFEEQTATIFSKHSSPYQLPTHLTYLISNLEVRELFEKSLSSEKVEEKSEKKSEEKSEKNEIFCKHNVQIQKDFFDITITHLKDSKGVLLGSVGVFYNVTERKKIERMKLDFVSNVSHEVRTPLSAIQGYMQLIKEDLGITPTFDHPSFDHQFTGHIDKVDKNIKRLLNLFDDLLKLSTIETKQDLKKEIIYKDQLHELCEGIINTLIPIYENKNISTNIEITGHSIVADINLLEQVLINLVDNAFKYTQSGGQINLNIADSCTYTPTSLAPSHTIIEVSDNGIGISAEHQDRIFERFYRVDTSHSREMGGTGLGLSIVKHIIQKHHGQIEVISNINRGSTFKVYLPKTSHGLQLNRNIFS
ncbi:MAG: hypothetical protein HQK49_05870 [Oligoflexia bacterium]|nr:hypothetical protein [Oligoflexia bacterium]